MIAITVQIETLLVLQVLLSLYLMQGRCASNQKFDSGVGLVVMSSEIGTGCLSENMLQRITCYINVELPFLIRSMSVSALVSIVVLLCAVY